MKWKAVLLSLAFMLCSEPARACLCFSTPMCHQVASRASLDSHAIFIGRVIDIWPSRKEVAEILGRSRADVRAEILRRWRGVLSPEEQSRIRNATSDSDWQQIEMRYAALVRVRFEVLETLNGPPQVREVYTDTSSCGYPFQWRRVYLVNASPGPRYHTGACMNTAPIDSPEAVEDLKAIRSWNGAGPRLAPRIYGAVSVSDLRSEAIRIRLESTKSNTVEERIPDPVTGSFSFENLDRGARYKLKVNDDAVSRDIDLTAKGCFNAFVSRYSGHWAIGGLP